VVQPSAVFSYFTAIAPMHPTLIREPFHRDGDCERIRFMCCKMEDELAQLKCPEKLGGMKCHSSLYLTW
jgi:hypothetical protein